MSNIIPAQIQPAFPRSVPRGQVRAKLLELLGLDEIPAAVPYEAETPRDEEDIRITHLTYANSLGEKVPGILLVPRKAPRREGPAIVCIPGTSGSAAEVADATFEEGGQVRGFGRELARRGYPTLAISIKGTVGRRQTAAHWEQEAKFLVAYGRPQMGIIAEEALRAARILAAQEQVDATRIGLTGMSLGGLATWYPMACAPWIRTGVPICGGIGSMARNIHEGLADRASSAIYVPHMLRYFDHPEIVAACIAPRPFMTIVPNRDEDMPPAGAAELIREVTPVYEAMGCPEHFKVYQPEGNHQFLVSYFELMAAWFDRFL